jgi:hypothetical protein
MLYIGAAALASRSARADDLDPFELQVHGFVSQGFIETTSGTNYLADSDKGSFEFAEVGLNVTKPITDRLRVGVQIFARDLGPVGNYSMKADWFYADYRWRDWLGIRVGRVKIPFGLFNDSSDIDSARLPILLPQSVYPVGNRDVLLAQTGFELYGYVPLGTTGALDYRAFMGTIYVDVPPPALGVSTAVTRFGVPYIVGGQVIWETPLPGLRLAGSLELARLEAQVTSVGVMPPPVVLDAAIDAQLWIASLEYTGEKIGLTAEYSRWHTQTTSTEPMIIPNDKVVSERGYAMVSYHLTNQLQIGSYFSVLYPDTRKRDGRENRQDDLALTARYDINPTWLFKVEGHWMNGTAGLDPSLNDGVNRHLMDRDWGVLLLKTTASF